MTAGSQGSIERMIPNLPHRRIEANVAQKPDSIALIADDLQYSYQTLNSSANFLSKVLRRYGAVQGSIVGIYLGICPEIVLATIATYKAGGTTLYLPADIPSGQVDSILNIDFKIIIAHSKHSKLCDRFKCDIIFIDKIAEIWNVHDSIALKCELTPNDIETIFLTSGSTGLPKLVRQPFGWYQESQDEVIEDERHILKTYSGTTFTRAEILYPLMKGHMLFLPPAHVRKNVIELVKYIENHKISHLIASPSWLRTALDADCISKFHHVKSILCAGEHANQKLKERFANEVGVPLKIMYGCTEVPGATSYIHQSKFDPRIETVGQVCPMKEVYLLDKNLNPVSTGERGDIYLSGLMAAGYLNDAAETNARFIENPFSKKLSDKMYKTGDVGRWLDGGFLQIIGREDNEVKVRGFRINTEEVERILSTHADIETCVVVPIRKAANSDKMVAFYKSKQGIKISFKNLSRHCAKYIPNYKIPSVFIQADEFNLLDNGKIDRKALERKYIEHEKDILVKDLCGTDQEVLVRIWARALLHDSFGPDDNFFEVGGDSLSLILMIMDVEKYFGVCIRDQDYFLSSVTIRGLLEKFSEDKKNDIFNRNIVTLKKGASSNSLYFAPVMNSFYDYKDLIAHLDESVTAYGLMPGGLFDGSDQYGSINKLSAECAEIIQKSNVGGVCIIAGYSGAGALAYDTAIKLQKSSSQDVLLVLLDAYCPYAFSMRRFFHAFSGAMRLKRGCGALTLLKFLLFSLLKKIGISLKFNDMYIHSLMSYRPEPIKSSVHFIVCENSRDKLYNSRLGWDKYLSGGVEYSIFPGDHHSYIREPMAHHVSSKLTELINLAYALKS